MLLMNVLQRCEAATLNEILIRATLMRALSDMCRTYYG